MRLDAEMGIQFWLLCWCCDGNIGVCVFFNAHARLQQETVRRRKRTTAMMVCECGRICVWVHVYVVMVVCVLFNAHARRFKVSTIYAK